jgi:hypothetical protein
MKFKTIVLLGVLLAASAFIACGLRSHTEPEININNADILGQGLFVNESAMKPYGVSTLYINVGDTLPLSVSTSLLKTPNYVWTPADDKVLKVTKDAANPLNAWAIAVGDSGAATTLKLSDVGNGAEKSIDVQIVKHWADPDFFNSIGNVNGHYFYISREVKTWTQARDICIEAGGYLAAISSAEENILLRSGMARLDSVWIGLKLNNLNEGLTNPDGTPMTPKWTLKFWDNGEALSFESFGEKISEPGIFYEVYYFMSRDSKWYSWHERPQYYFLEME